MYMCLTRRACPAYISIRSTPSRTVAVAYHHQVRGINMITGAITYTQPRQQQRVVGCGGSVPANLQYRIQTTLAITPPNLPLPLSLFSRGSSGSGDSHKPQTKQCVVLLRHHTAPFPFKSIPGTEAESKCAFFCVPQF